MSEFELIPEEQTNKTRTNKKIPPPLFTKHPEGTFLHAAPNELTNKAHLLLNGLFVVYFL